MKSVVKVSLLLAMVFMIAVMNVEAQPGNGRGKAYDHGPGPRHGYPDSCRIQLMVDDMKKALSLTDEQVDEIEQIHYAHIQEAKSIDEKYSNDCVAAREAHWALRDKMDSEVKGVLNDEQKNKYEEFMNERRGPHNSHKKHWQ
jgi:Spy/CpxP family protein refolding chaperone